jgi:hypothetical protein
MPLWEEQCSVACAVQNLALQVTAMGLAGESDPDPSFSLYT